MRKILSSGRMASRTLAFLAASSGMASAQDEKPAQEAPLQRAADAPSIDFARVSRELKGEPTYLSAKPRYALFLFGDRGERRLWISFDKSSSESPLYDVCWVDRDFDLVLGEEGERVAVAPERSGDPQKVELEIGELRVPGENGETTLHTGFTFVVRPDFVLYRLRWRGAQQTLGGYGPDPQSYAKLGTSREEAPIFVPGWDRPFQFEHWMSGVLSRGRENDFKVFVGNRGDRRGAFSCVDQKFLLADEPVQATLIYRDGAGKEQRFLALLRERC
ncbi:MAG: hypothetical protein IPN34_08390 [Planctomycetes bacterium]|nr:hypothetical protein [Planctomycetota bacterium]